MNCSGIKREDYHQDNATKTGQPERRSVDHMLGVIHPDGIRDPAWIRGCHIKIRVWIRVNINLILPLEPQLVIVDADMTELAGDDVHIGGAGGDANDLDYCLSPDQPK